MNELISHVNEIEELLKLPRLSRSEAARIFNEVLFLKYSIPLERFKVALNLTSTIPIR